MDTVEAVDTINLEPHWASMARFFARALMAHDFHQWSREPVISFVKIIRYLSITDPEEVAVILKELEDGRL